MVKKIVSISATCLFLLVGCGGGSSDEPSSDNNTGSENTDSGEGTNSANNTVLTGVFVDSPVEGVSYSTATQSGTTNSAGEFNYIAGEQIVFSIGGMQLPEVQASDMITPVDIASSSSDVNQTALNVARLLQSLDQDGNPDNGIFIPAAAAASASEITFDVSTDVFESDANVVNLVSNSGSTNTVLISTEATNSHLQESLGISLLGDSGTTFSTSMLVGRTLIPYPIDQALNPNFSVFRFDSSSEVMIIGTPGGQLGAGEFPWSLDNNGVVAIDFNDFEAGAVQTLELESNAGDILTVENAWLGVPNPIDMYTLSTPVTANDFSGRSINVQSAGGSGSIEFRSNGEYELSNSGGDIETGLYSQHPVDGIIVGDFPSSYSEYVLASGTLDNGFLMKSDYGDSGIFRVEFFEISGNNWTALHVVTR